MKQIAEVRGASWPARDARLSGSCVLQEKDVDLLLVDSGDLHDGTPRHARSGVGVVGC